MDFWRSAKFLVALLFLALLAFAATFDTAVTQAAVVFSDDFNNGTIDSGRWRRGVLTKGPLQVDSQISVTEQSGRLAVSLRSKAAGSKFNGLVSQQQWNVSGSTVSVHVVQKASSTAETIFSIGIDNANYLRYRSRSTSLYLESSVNGKVSTTSISSTSDPRYWRFRHIASSDTIVFETSSDAATWISRRTVSRPFNLANLYVEIGAGTSSAVSSPGTALFDDFRLDQGETTTPTPTPVPTASPQPTPTPSGTPPSGNSTSRGYLTTPGELAQVKSKAEQNIQPYKNAVSSLLSIAGSPTSWSPGTVDPNDRDQLGAAASLVYAKALAYHLSGNTAYAAEARRRILEISSTDTCSNSYSGGNGCILTLSRHIAGYVAAADLLEDYSGWSSSDKSRFQTWLRDEVYRFTDWASDTRSTNWGSVGTMTTLYIADYFAYSGMNLVDRSGNSISPHNAFVEARQRAFDRNNGNSYMYNSVCSITTGLGIQYHGGIPEETGRDSTGCFGTYLLTDDSSFSYMIAHLSGTLPTAELLWRRGDPSLYNNIQSDGGGSILRAIMFVIDNPYDPNPPQHSFDWIDSRKSILEIAYRYYRHPSIARQLGIGLGSRHIAGDGNTAMPHFGTLTHGFSTNENPGPPPVVPAP